MNQDMIRTKFDAAVLAIQLLLDAMLLACTPKNRNDWALGKLWRGKYNPLTKGTVLSVVMRGGVPTLACQRSFVNPATFGLTVLGYWEKGTPNILAEEKEGVTGNYAVAFPGAKDVPKLQAYLEAIRGNFGVWAGPKAAAPAPKAPKASKVKFA